MTSQRFTADDAARARALFGQGLGCNAIARELGFSPARISRWAKGEGLAFDRAQTAVATTAKVRSLQERRAALVDRLYTRSERILDRLEKGDAGEFRMLVRGEAGAEHDQTLDFIPTQAERDLTAAISGYLAASAKLILQDPAEGLTEAHSLLDSLAAGFAAAAANYDPVAENAVGDAS